MRVLLILTVVIFVSYSCGNDQTEKSSLESIDISDIFENQQKAMVSQYVSSIDYVPLELKPGTELLPNVAFVVTNSHIIARSTSFGKSQLLMFDKKNGIFIKEIASSGRGPDEYDYPVRDFYNYSNNVIYTFGFNREIKCFNLEGKKINSFKLPVWKDTTTRVGSRYGSFHAYLDTNIFVNFVENNSGVERKKIVLFTKDSIYRVYPNFLSWEQSESNVIVGYGSTKQFFRFENKLFFKEVFNDTVFKITKERLLPRFTFFSGKHTLTYEKQNKYLLSKEYKNYYLITDIDESPRDIFFQLAYQDRNYSCIYNKSTRTCIMCEVITDNTSALIDDINGFLPLVPADITNKNDMICVLQPMDVKKWIDKNPEKVSLLNSRLPWLKEYSEFDNPVIVIAHLKN